MSLLETLTEKISGQGLTVVLPEGEEPRVVEAAERLVEEHGVDVVLLGSGEAPAGCQMENPAESHFLEEFSSIYADIRSTKPGMASRAVRKPLYFGAMLVRTGRADLMVAGATHPTRRVIEAAHLCIGLQAGTSVPSSFFLMEFDDRSPLIFADCAVNIEPTVEELADIAVTTSANAAVLLGASPRVALLSLSTKGSASHERVTRVQQALEVVRRKAPDLLVDGELQVDSALVPDIAATKGLHGSHVAGQANVLIFPDLDAGNIGYKLVQQLARASATGPILQGFARPVADLSRGASVDDIVATSIVSLAMGAQ